MLGTLNSQIDDNILQMLLKLTFASRILYGKKFVL